VGGREGERKCVRESESEKDTGGEGEKTFIIVIKCGK
jgi:hypothetical protein